MFIYTQRQRLGMATKATSQKVKKIATLCDHVYTVDKDDQNRMCIYRDGKIFVDIYEHIFEPFDAPKACVVVIYTSAPVDFVHTNQTVAPL